MIEWFREHLWEVLLGKSAGPCETKHSMFLHYSKKF